MILPAIHCRRCKTLMDLVATIQPIGIHPGLHAYAARHADTPKASSSCRMRPSAWRSNLALARDPRASDWLGRLQRNQRDVECAHDPRHREIKIGPALQLIDEAVLDQS